MSLLIRQLPVPFNFYRLVLQEDHLHFGYWPDESQNLTLEQAQESMFDLLLSHFPEPSADVLDVGSGLGLAAHKLAKIGYKVTAIAPSDSLINYAKEKYAGDGVCFQSAAFLESGDVDFCSRKYDVILFQESLQYLSPLREVFQRSRSLLKDGGILVTGDELWLDPAIKTETAVHSLADVISSLLERGFRITAEKAIKQNVIKTCDDIIGRFSEHFGYIVSTVANDKTAAQLEHFLNGWRSQKTWYENGQMGYHIFAAKKDKVFMKTYERDDEHRILPMFNEVFGQNRTLDHWYWKFRDNPFGKYQIAEALTEGGDLAAHYAGYPVPFYSTVGGAKEFLSLQIGDTMTHPRFRTLGLGTTSVLTRITKYFYNRLCERVFSFNYGFNTGNIRKFGRRFLGYEPISNVPYFTLDLNKRGLIRPSSVRSFLSGFKVEEVSRVTEEYDRFFEHVAADYGILVHRNSSYLKWRYLDCPDKVYRIFAVRRFGKLTGWSVFASRDDILLWGDALFNEKYARTALIILNFALKQNYRDKKRIEGWFSAVPQWWTNALIDSGFAVTSEPNELAPAFKIFDKNFSARFFENYFYYAMGDSDLF